MTATIGAKNGDGWPKTSVATHHATPAATAHWTSRKTRDRSLSNRVRRLSRLRSQARSSASMTGASPLR